MTDTTKAQDLALALTEEDEQLSDEEYNRLVNQPIDLGNIFVAPPSKIPAVLKEGA